MDMRGFMSKISISEPMTDLRAIKFLHNLLGMSLSTAKKSLLNGKNGVFFCAELYLNDHREVAGNILKIVNFLMLSILKFLSLR